jgi:glucosamine-6-phosphate deaminase
MSDPTAAPAKSPAIHIFDGATRAADAAAKAAAAIIRSRLQSEGHARLLLATGNSQVEMMHRLVREPDIDWARVEAFHLDEYVGLPADHPASFRRWIKTRFSDRVRPRVTHFIAGDSPALEEDIGAYGCLLLAAPIDIAFVGIGENGHIAFNDPHVADFSDPLVIKRVTLDQACRTQQVGEGHFCDLASVPREAISVTCSGLFRARAWICCVPDGRKAAAVSRSLEGIITTACPGSLVQRHPTAAVFLDAASASQLSPAFIKSKCHVHPAQASLSRA